MFAVYLQQPVCNVLQPCKEAKSDGSEMVCRMPAVNLPDDLYQQLNETESRTINNTQGPGVAAFVSSDRLAHADIYIGLKLDGFTYYENISYVDTSIKMQFALKPTLLCNYDDVDFDPHKDKIIAIKVDGYCRF